MDRRQVLRWGAGTAVVGLTGVTAYHGVTGQPPGDGRRPNGTSTGGPTDTADSPTTSPDHSTATPEEPTTTEAPPVRREDEFSTVVNAIQVGADPAGNEPIGALLERYAGDDTLLSFPAGTYRLPQVKLLDYDHLGIAAAYDQRPTFVAPANSCIDTDPHLQFGRVTDFLLEGIDFDFRRDGAGGAVNVIASGDATVRDVTARGSCRQQITMFRIDVRAPSGSAVVERLRLRNVQDSGWLTGAYVGKHHSGEVTFRNCEIREFSDNGLYGSAPGLEGGGGGTVHSVGGHYENNNVSNIRLGTAESSARGDTIVVESAPDAGSVNLRGIRLRRGGDQVVEDCDIRFGPGVKYSFGAIVFHADTGAARITDTRITMDSDGVSAVNAFYHSGTNEGGPTFENLTVDGEASRGYAVQVNGRDGTVFRNCTIEQPGTRRDGIRIAYSKGCELVDSRIDVTGYPLILRDTTMTIRNTTFLTPNGEHYVDHMEAGPGDFRPETWTQPATVTE